MGSPVDPAHGSLSITTQLLLGHCLLAEIVHLLLSVLLCPTLYKELLLLLLLLLCLLDLLLLLLLLHLASLRVNLSLLLLLWWWTVLHRIRGHCS